MENIEYDLAAAGSREEFDKFVSENIAGKSGICVHLKNFSEASEWAKKCSDKIKKIG